MNGRRPDRSDFVQLRDGVWDKSLRLMFARGADGRLNGNMPFSEGCELSEFIERYEMAKLVDEDWHSCSDFDVD